MALNPYQQDRRTIALQEAILKIRESVKTLNPDNQEKIAKALEQTANKIRGIDPTTTLFEKLTKHATFKNFP